MADIAHEWTDGQLEALQRWFRKAYAQAEREMGEKLKKLMADYERQNSKWQERVREGKAKQEDYDAWKESQATNQSWMRGIVKTLAEDAARTDRLANEYINDEIPHIFAENANMAAYEVESHLGADTHSFDLYDQDTVRRLIAEQPQLLPRVPEPKFDNGRDMRWNQQKFSSVITQSVLQGESIPNAAKRVSNVMRMNESAATRAARTAITGAENAGRVHSYERAKSIGIELEQEWMATLDKRTRHSHRVLDGQHVPVGHKFMVDGVGLEYPGDPSAPGEYVWNCRCALVAWFPDIEQEDPKRFSRLPMGMSYEDWKSGKVAEEKRKEASGVVDGRDMTKTWRPDRANHEFDIRDIIHQQGFDGKPKVVDPDEFSRLAMDATDNGLIMQRAYGAPSQEVLDSYREALYGGEFYVDCSGGHMYGRGMYASWSDGVEPTRAMQIQSERYARSHGAKVGYVETMTLDKSARVISYEELTEQWENDEIPQWIREGDDGVLAAALGYDAIRIDRAGEMVVLNRTKLIIRRPE